jgi:transcriptional regulator with XRE-family HTH domain
MIVQNSPRKRNHIAGGKMNSQLTAVEAEEPGDVRVGQRLRMIRRERKLSVNELAARAGVSASLVSQIERGRANPSIKTLVRLRSALGVPLSALVDEEESPSDGGFPDFVRRATQRTRFGVGSEGLMKELLSPKRAESLQFMMIDFPPGVTSSDVLIGPGEKAGLVIEGQVELTVEERRVVLGEGDSFQFSSSLPHSVRNISGAFARVLWIISVTTPAPHL